MARTDPLFNLRIPIELKEQIEKSAKDNGRSTTAEMLKALEFYLNRKSSLHFEMSMTLSEQLSQLAEKAKELEQK